MGKVLSGELSCPCGRSCLGVTIKMSGYNSVFYFHFAKGNNFYDFLLAFLDDESLPKNGLPLNERICSIGANSFL